jgi:alcohol dehydrogenase (cytochrome c)
MLNVRPFDRVCGASTAVLALIGGMGLAQEQLQQAAPLAAVLQNYRPVTALRLKKPEDGDWLMIRRTYDGWGYSPLDQITPNNVSRLQPLWVFSTGVANGHEAPPIVNNGVMFVATPGSQVIAIDAKTGVLLWRYRKPLPEDVVVLHPTSRGVALYGDKVFLATNDAMLVSIDVRTGKEVWVRKVEENKNGYYITLAPLVADGKVMVGASGGELGIRGFVAAFDVESGKEVWRVYTVPAPGEPGSETWPEGDQWKNGGGPVWVTGNYDPETNLAFWGTGNGGPWMGDQRPGDNLYTASTIAIDVATGRIKGHHQYHPNDSWDWDEVSPPILVDYKRNGRTVKGLIDVARDGYLWFLERTDGENWPPIAFSPKTRFIYIPANENLCSTITGREVEYEAGRSYTGATSTLQIAPRADHIGEVQAWNVDTGKRVWTHTYEKSQNWGPMLATGGGLVFNGGTNDRKFHAFDASKGTLLWEFPTNSGITGQPSSFMIDGKQYIAVQAGWGIDARAMQARLNGASPGNFPEVPEGGAIWVFGIR